MVVVVVVLVVVWVVVVVVVVREGERKMEGEMRARAVKLPCGLATTVWSS